MTITAPSPVGFSALNDLDALEASAERVLPTWRSVCNLSDLEPNWGEAALLDGHQIALFRLPSGEVYAVDQRDPATEAHVMARGIVGSRGDRPTIASPLHKQVYDLRTGERLDGEGTPLAAYPARVVDGIVQIAA
ncbi:nitrite reductase small subunit NirD [Sinomonas sp. JGH33]|uniref:Nitrite reductase small subunit NirD n=1 Tax=Sinomonas terricola TaxID=3110330 RepID=A0ABU5TAD9_9MICC|nr:nitrite reductase small subunit NirD [Sinomonas sp. JGH33]MEA5456645.1 nitrite reductase small subunit NirD [Sinomonas sp. JGH33]